VLALVVQVAEERFVVPAARVVEVLPRVQLSPVPRAAPWHAGMLSYRGAGLPVLDLSRRLGDEACAPRIGNRVLVVDVPRPGGSERWGVLVEQVLQVRDVEAATAHGMGRVVGLGDGLLLQVLDLGALLEGQDSRMLGSGAATEAR
jgi:chemotaxis signal transduction protein